MQARPLIIYYNDADGKQHVRCKVPKWQFSDKAMSVGKQYVSFNLESEVPVNFGIGDYCIYRGQYFYLNNLSTTEQKAGVGESGDAFKYDSVRFDSDSEKLGRIIILDITPTTGDYVAAKGTNFTGSSQFQLFCAETKVTVNGQTRVLTPVCYLANILKANLDRAFPKDGWQVHVNLSSTETKYGKVQLVTHTDDKVLSFNGTTAAAALAEVNTTFDLDYFIKGRDIYIGYTLSAITSDDPSVKEDTSKDTFFYFGYGKGYADSEHQGKALFDIKRNANQNQNVITRLRALGSTKNMPYRYYNKRYDLPQDLFPTNLQLPDTFETPDVKSTNNALRKKQYPFLRDVKGDTNDSYIDKNDDALSTTEGLREGRAMWDGSDSKLEEIYPTIKEGTYRDLRAASQTDSDGYTEKSTAKTDGNGKHSFLNYLDDERVDEILAPGKMNGSTTLDDANVGNGIDEDPAASARGTVDIPLGYTKEYFVDSSSIQVKSAQYVDGQRTLWTYDIGTIVDQYAGEYTLAPNNHNYMVLGARINGNDSNAKLRVAFRMQIYATPTSTNTESLIYDRVCDYTEITTGDYKELSMPVGFPDTADGDTGKIVLTEHSNVRGKLSIVIWNISAKEDSFIDLYVGKSKKSADTNVAFTAQFRWGPVDKSAEYLNTPFHIIIKDMGFDLKAQFNGSDTPTVEMQDGYCAGRKFKIGDDIQKVTYRKSGKDYVGYQLSLSRDPDTSIHKYYPSETNPIKEGDHYILTGIQMPDVYVRMAETRLLVAATQYLADNDETKYTYEPSLDNIYLARNYDKCNKDGDVTKSVYWNLYAGLKFPFRGLPETDDKNETLPFINITIETLTIKEEDGYTPKVEMTLNEDIEQSTYNKITTAVDRIYNGSLMNEFLSNASLGGSSKSDMIALIQEQGKVRFLSKTQDDSTPHKLTMGEAEVSGNATVGGDVSVNGSTGSNKITVGTYKAGVSGGVLQNTAKDGSYLEVDRMLVRAKATFNSLEIAKIQYSSGQRIVGKGGVVLTKVEDMKDGDGNIIAYKCYFNSKLDDRYYHNPFIVKDQAIAQSWDDDKNSGNHRYWRLVTDVGEDAAAGVGYIVLSNASDKCEANSDAPRVDDKVCQLGYQGTDQPDRQSAIMESTIGDNAPYYTMFQHINSFSLAGCDILTFGNKDGRGYIQVYGDAYVGDRNGDTTYIKYDSNKKQLDIKAKLTATAGSDFTDSGMEKGEGNLIKNSGFTGDYSSAVIEDGATITSDTKIYSDPWGSWTLHTGCTINDDAASASGKSCTLDSGTLTQAIAYPLLKGTCMLTLMHKNDEQLTITFGGATVIVNASANYKRENIKIEVTDTSATTFSITGSGTICELQLQAGNVSSAAWTPSHSDNNRYLGYYSALQYLLDAIANGSTQTLGGLVLTQMLKVGNYTNGAMAQETGGMNGEYNNDNSPFLWGGGTLEQAIATIAMYAEDPNFSPTDEQLKQMAKFVVTHGGRAILTDMIMRGYIYALGGVFKGDIRVDGTLTGGTLKGTTVEGLKGTFKELSALDSKGVAKASVYLSEDGRLTFDGDMYNQGRDSEENRTHRFYSGDIFCRGSFGHLSRFVALVTGSTMQVFPKGDDGTTAVTLHLESATASNGKTYYKVPLYVSAMTFPDDFLDTSKDFHDVSGMPIDVVAFNVTAETYYLLTNFGCGKGVDVVNTNDDVTVYLCDNGGWNRLLGGASTHFFYLPPKFINNPPTAEGVGLFKLDNHDINW